MLGKLQYPNCVQWSNGDELTRYLILTLLDGHLILNTQSEIQITIPEVAKKFQYIRWMTVKSPEQMFCTLKKINRLSVNYWFRRSWLPDSSCSRSIVNCDWCPSGCGMLLSLIAILLNDGTLVIVQLNTFENHQPAEFETFGLCVANLVSSTTPIQDAGLHNVSGKIYSLKAAISCFCWSTVSKESIFQESQTKFSHPRIPLLVTGNMLGTVEIWGLCEPETDTRPFSSTLLLAIPLISVLFTHTLEPESVTGPGDLSDTLVGLTSIAAIPDESCTSLIIGLSNGMLVRLDVKLSAGYQWKISWCRQIFDCSIDCLRVLTLEGVTLFVISGQLGTLIPFDQNNSSFPNNVHTPHHGCIDFWNHCILSFDIITSCVIVNYPKNLDTNMLEGIDGIECPNYPFSKFQQYALVASLDGTISLIPFVGSSTGTDSRMILFRTHYQISGLSVDPLGLSFSLVLNSNESPSKRYYQAEVHSIMFKLLPWCPIASVRNDAYLESLMSCIIKDSSKGGCSLSTLYTFLIHGILECDTGEGTMVKEFLFDESGADGFNYFEVESRVNFLIQRIFLICTSISRKYLRKGCDPCVKATPPVFYPIHHFPEDLESHRQKYRLWQCLFGLISSIQKHYSPVFLDDTNHLFLLVTTLRHCLRLSWLSTYVKSAYDHFSVAIVEARINDSGGDAFDDVHSLPPQRTVDSWFNILPIPTRNESYSLFLASQHLHFILENYYSIERPQLFPQELISSAEVSNLLKISVSMQIYCERVRLIYYASNELKPYGYTCQYCGCYETYPQDSLKRMCSNCHMSTDICVRSCLPLEFQEQPMVLTCPQCKTCVEQSLSSMTFLHNLWTSLTMCLFCSIPLIKM